jgi:hypothetical protein
MTTTAIRKEIHKAIDIIESEQMLKAIHMLVQEEIKHAKEALKPFSVEEFYMRNAQSQKEIKQGKLIDHARAKKKYIAGK